MSKDKDDWPKHTVFLDELENKPDGSIKGNAIKKYSTNEVFFITSLPHESSDEIMSALISLSKEISDGK